MRVTPAMKQRIRGEFIKHGQDLFDKPITETFTAAVIPVSGLDNVSLCFRS